MTDKVSAGTLPYYYTPKYTSLKNLNSEGDMRFVLRAVLLIFGIVVMPIVLISIPLYLRHKVYTERAFAVTESDVLEIEEGISNIFCQGHSLKMNTTFSAFRVNKKSTVPDRKRRRHIKLNKSMLLPDDSLEYWGFFLTQGSTVNVSVCSRYEGARILVVKDGKDFHSCGLLERTKPQNERPRLAEAKDVRVSYKNPASSEDYEGEDMSMETLDELKKYAEMYLRKRVKLKFDIKSQVNENMTKNDKTEDVRVKREDINISHKEGLLHGKTDNESSTSDVSSFEDTLLSCHNGRIFFNSAFGPSHHCNSVGYLEEHRNFQVQHRVHEEGYYFYIFYSDNDYVDNEIFAIFDIYKPSYEYANYSAACINKTECNFKLEFGSEEKIIVEVPMRDGIEHEEDDITVLHSVCQPRMLIYMIFPISLMVIMLLVSFT